MGQIRGHELFWNCKLLVYRLMQRGTSLIHTSEMKLFLSLPSIILVLIFFNVKTLIMLMFFLQQAYGWPTWSLWATWCPWAPRWWPLGQMFWFRELIVIALMSRSQHLYRFFKIVEGKILLANICLSGWFWTSADIAWFSVALNWFSVVPFSFTWLFYRPCVVSYFNRFVSFNKIKKIYILIHWVVIDWWPKFSVEKQIFLEMSNHHPQIAFFVT